MTGRVIHDPDFNDSSDEDSDDLEGREFQADRSWLVPLRVHWKGASANEQAHLAFLRRLDALVVPMFAIWYLLQAFLATPWLPDSGPGPVDHLWVHSVLAVLAVWILGIHCTALPSAREDQEAFGVQQKIGRWVALTRHCLALQAWHQVMSLLSFAFPQLVALTHGVSVWIATLGWFVTIQYFVLVVPSPAMEEECAEWAERDVQFREVGLVNHVFALPIALVDLVWAKNAADLNAFVDTKRTFGLVFLYLPFYLTLISINFNITGYWPYGFMKEFGTNPKKWAGFLLVQAGILTAFVCVNMLMIWAKIVI